MNTRIIYPTDEGGVAVIIPAPDARRQVLVSEDVYRTITVPATDDAPEHQALELVTPAVYRPETDAELVAWIAAKDVPAGKPFKIVDASDIPADRTLREAWEVDQTEMTDGIGADYGVGSNNVVTGWNADNTPVIQPGAAQ